MIPSEGELFKKILGPTWRKLHPDIQARFDKNPVPGKPLYYTGTLSELSCSRVGRLLGYLSMPFVKGALMPYNDADFPVDIQVYSRDNCAWIFKERTYRLHARKPCRVCSRRARPFSGIATTAPTSSISTSRSAIRCLARPLRKQVSSGR